MKIYVNSKNNVRKTLKTKNKDIVNLDITNPAPSRTTIGKQQDDVMLSCVDHHFCYCKECVILDGNKSCGDSTSSSPNLVSCGSMVSA